MSWLWLSEIEGSSSMILAMAAVSFTSSFFSLAAMARPNTGRAGGMVSSFTGFDFSATSVSPVLVLSSLPKATVSPGFASPRLVGLAQQGERSRDALIVGSASTVAPSAKVPVSTRLSDSLPPARCGRS